MRAIHARIVYSHLREAAVKPLGAPAISTLLCINTKVAIKCFTSIEFAYKKLSTSIKQEDPVERTIIVALRASLSSLLICLFSVFS